MGEKTEPCGTPFVKCLVVKCLSLSSERKLAIHFLKLGCMSVLKIFFISRWRRTVSNASLMSMAAISVMCAGFC